MIANNVITDHNVLTDHIVRKVLHYHHFTSQIKLQVKQKALASVCHLPSTSNR